RETGASGSARRHRRGEREATCDPEPARAPPPRSCRASARRAGRWRSALPRRRMPHARRVRARRAGRRRRAVVHGGREDAGSPRPARAAQGARRAARGLLSPAPVRIPTRRRRPGLPIFLLTFALAGAAAPAARAEREPPPVGAAPAANALHWSLAERPVPAEGGLLALAIGPGGARAAGDARGLLLAGPAPDATWRRIPLRGAVHDLAFAPDGALWV